MRTTMIESRVFAVAEGVRFVFASRILALPVILLLILSTIKFLRRFREWEEDKPSIAPFAVPLLGHTHLLLARPARLASVLSGLEPSKQIFQLKIPFSEIWFAKGPSQIRQTLSDPATFDFEPMKTMALKRILGLGSKVVDLANRDDSGVGRKPLPGSTVPQGKRCNYLERQATKDFTRPASHAAFLEKFETGLYQRIEECGIGGEWIDYPDLYQFIQSILFRVTTDAFYGPHLLATAPNLEKDILTFDKNVPFHAKGLPRLLNPQAGIVRTRCIAAMRTWRASALNERAAQLPEWNENSGLKTTTLRKEVFEHFKEWDAESCAASDLAVLFGITSNSIRATFWFFLETLRSVDHAGHAAREISCVNITPPSNASTRKDLPRFDTKRLIRLPLLQSLFAETLRMYVSVMIVRTARKSCKLGDYAVQKHQKLMVCNYAQHMDERLWKADDPSIPSLSSFWGRRFLSTSETGISIENSDEQSTRTDSNKGQSRENKPRFTGEGLGTQFIPFGMGERMCPGRHFAKLQTLLTYALVIETFDIELMIHDRWKPIPDWSHFGYGTMPPAMSTPFRIRRKSLLAR